MVTYNCASTAEKKKEQKMGSCYSLPRKISPCSPPSACVIASDGSLQQYYRPVAVSNVLGADLLSNLLCNGDAFDIDMMVPAMRASDFLELGQLYFVLPGAMLSRPISLPEIATLAVKASAVLPSRVPSM